MAATCPVEVGKGGKNTEKAEKNSSNTYLEHPTCDQAKVGTMIGYKRSPPKHAQSFTSKDGARFITLSTTT